MFVNIPEVGQHDYEFAVGTHRRMVTILDHKAKDRTIVGMLKSRADTTVYSVFILGTLKDHRSKLNDRLFIYLLLGYC